VQPRVRIVAADPHPVFLDGLACGIKEARPDLDLVATARDGREALRHIRQLRPEVALVEHDLPTLDGGCVLTAIRRDALPTRVLFLSARSDGEVIYAAIAAGAAGWVTKDANRQQIGDAVAAVQRGEMVLSPSVHAGVADEIAARAGDDPPALTSRERQVLVLIANGSTINRVAAQLGMSRATVKTHLQHLYEKLGVSSQAAAVAEALRRGLMD
jgi:two-component system, NarL family, nitrate/nitrite response regulator NarL